MNKKCVFCSFAIYHLHATVVIIWCEIMTMTTMMMIMVMGCMRSTKEGAMLSQVWYIYCLDESGEDTCCKTQFLS